MHFDVYILCLNNKNVKPTFSNCGWFMKIKIDLLSVRCKTYVFCHKLEKFYKDNKKFTPEQ